MIKLISFIASFLLFGSAFADDLRSFGRSAMVGGNETEKNQAADLFHAVSMLDAAASVPDCWPQPSQGVKTHYLSYRNQADLFDNMMKSRSQMAPASPESAKVAFTIQRLAVMARAIAADMLAKNKCYDMAVTELTWATYYTPIGSQRANEFNRRIQQLVIEKSMQ